MTRKVFIVTALFMAALSGCLKDPEEELKQKTDDIYVSNDGSIVYSSAGSLYTEEFQLTLSTDVINGVSVIPPMAAILPHNQANSAVVLKLPTEQANRIPFRNLRRLPRQAAEISDRVAPVEFPVRAVRHLLPKRRYSKAR